MIPITWPSYLREWFWRLKRAGLRDPGPLQVTIVSLPLDPTAAVIPKIWFPLRRAQADRRVRMVEHFLLPSPETLATINLSTTVSRPARNFIPNERELKLVSWPLTAVLDKSFVVIDPLMPDLVAGFMESSYWAEHFSVAWRHNRWPLRRTDESEVLTVGSEGFRSSNHDSLSA